MSTRVSINDDTLYAVEDALSYYLLASAENFGSGDHDEELEQKRADVQKFLDRLASKSGL